MMIEKNVFRDNMAYSGTCLYLEEDNVSNYVVVKRNQFINDVAMHVA